MARVCAIILGCKNESRSHNNWLGVCIAQIEVLLTDVDGHESDETVKGEYRDGSRPDTAARPMILGMELNGISDSGLTLADVKPNRRRCQLRCLLSVLSRGLSPSHVTVVSGYTLVFCMCMYSVFSGSVDIFGLCKIAYYTFSLLLI